MTAKNNNITRFIVDTALYAPRHNMGDELFLRPFSGNAGSIPPGTELVLRTREGRMIIGDFYNVEERGISLLQPHKETTIFIDIKRAPILFEITAIKRTKARKNRQAQHYAA